MPKTARAAKAEVGRDARERILEAALAAFAQNGFEGSTTRDIAARAKVTLGLVQYYYGTKLELWKSAVDHAFAEIVEGFDALLEDLATGDERERLRLVIREYVSFVSRKPEFARLMHEEGKRSGPRMRWLVDRYVKPMHQKLRPLVLSAQQQELLPPGIAPMHFVYALVGAVDVIFHQAEECKRLTGVDPTDPAVAQTHALAIEHLFLGPKNEENTQ